MRTAHWDVVHCFGTSIEGWSVLVLGRHVASLAELEDAEAAELGPLVRNVSRALAAVVECEKTYVVQFAEAPGHNHVHVHVIPRRPDMPVDDRGPNIFKFLGLPPDECVPDERMDEIAAAFLAWWRDDTDRSKEAP